MPRRKRRHTTDIERLDARSQRLLYQAKALMLCGLPHDRIEETQFSRSMSFADGSEITVTYKTTGEILPYGMDRVLLAWLQTRSDRRGFVPIKTVSEYLQTFEMGSSGGNYDEFEKAINRLRDLVISVDITNGSARGFVDIKFIESGFFPGDDPTTAFSDDPELQQLVLFEDLRYGLHLHPKFVRYFQENRVPMPVEIMKRYYRSPMLWDFAEWSLWRCYTAASPSYVPWQVVTDQVSCKDSNRSRARSRFERVIDEIREVPSHSEFPAMFTEDYLLYVEPWRPK